jgi:hypothetical protein
MIRLGINLVSFKKDYKGGINSFALGLIKALEKKNIQLNIYTNKESKFFLQKIFKKSKITTIEQSKIIYLFLQLFCLLFNKKKLFINLENAYYKKIKKIIDRECDVFYCPLSYLAPFNLNIPTVSSIHDLQHLHYQNYFNILQLKYRNFSFDETMKKSTILQASSRFIKKDINKFYPNINKNKIKVINEGISEDFKFKKVNFNKKNYIFFPAQLWKHKNHMTVLKSIKFLKDSFRMNIKLIMVGQKFTSSRKILNFINKNNDLNIEYLGKVNFKKLIYLYENCKFLISPAIYESSSIPILEACKIGRPVICSDTPPNKELGKKLKINFFKTKDYINLANVIKILWKNNKFIDNQIKFNKKNIHKYSWDKISNDYYTIFSKLNKNIYN